MIDAKGDLVVGTADNTVARKAVGANDTLLVADSGQTEGVKWATIGNASVAAAAGIAVSNLAAGASSRQVLGMVGGVPTWIDAPTYLTNTTPVGTGAVTTEVDLQTVSISANALTVGDIVRITAAGTSSGGSGAKWAKLYFGGTQIGFCDGDVSMVDWWFQASAVVTGASAQKFTTFGAFETTNASWVARLVAPAISSPAIAISGSITVKTTGQTPSSAADEVTSEMLTVELIPA